MAPPTTPTASSIVTEALKRFLDGGTPATADVTRATSYGLEKVKRDIMLLGKTWRPLLKTAYDITVANQPRYANASDFAEDFRVSLMTGTHTANLSAVTSTTDVTLAADEDATATEAQGKYLLITAGTGVDQARPIYSYSATTKKALLSEAFSTSPVMGDTYLICNSIKDLVPLPDGFFTLLATSGTAGTPVRYSQKKNATTGELVLHPAPSGAFGIRREYYADLQLLDITEGTTLYTTILTRWAGILEQGVYVWRLGEDDDRYERENGIYQDMLIALMARDLDGYSPATTGGKE